MALEVRGGPGDRRWREGFAGSGMDQSNSTRGGCCCTLSPALAAVDAELRQIFFFPPTFADPLTVDPPYHPGAAAGAVGPPGRPPWGPHRRGQSCDQRSGVQVSDGHGGLLATWVSGAGLGTI